MSTEPGVRRNRAHMTSMTTSPLALFTRTSMNEMIEVNHCRCHPVIKCFYFMWGVVRIRRRVLQNGSQELLDAWNSKETRALAINACMYHNVQTMNLDELSLWC